MRDAVGGSAAIFIIMIFIVVALGYLAFNVNYTKAFRMKNKIISVYEDYDGECSSKCQEHIKKYAATIGYLSADINCPKGYKGMEDLYCIKEVEVHPNNSGEEISDLSNRSYYKIITKINVDVPVIRNIFDLRIFQITGDTKTFIRENRKSDS